MTILNHLILFLSDRIIIKYMINQNFLHFSRGPLSTVEFKLDFFSFENNDNDEILHDFCTCHIAFSLYSCKIFL